MNNAHITLEAYPPGGLRPQACSELCSQIARVMAQAWPDGAVEFAIGDWGIGVRAGLAENPNFLGIDDREALDLAIRLVLFYGKELANKVVFKGCNDTLKALIRFVYGNAMEHRKTHEVSERYQAPSGGAR